jgi:hypothetical protein
MKHRTELLPTGYEMTITPQPWIPVSERLPEAGVRVLIFCPLAEPNEVAAAVLRHEGMWRMDDGEVYGETEPTHWMPLPEPPEVK